MESKYDFFQWSQATPNKQKPWTQLSESFNFCLHQLFRESLLIFNSTKYRNSSLNIQHWILMDIYPRVCRQLSSLKYFLLCLFCETLTMLLMVIIWHILHLVLSYTLGKRAIRVKQTTLHLLLSNHIKKNHLSFPFTSSGIIRYHPSVLNLIFNIWIKSPSNLRKTICYLFLFQKLLPDTAWYLLVLRISVETLGVIRPNLRN